MPWPGGWPETNGSQTTRSGINYTMQRTPGGDSDTNYKESWTPNLVNSSFVAAVKWDDIGAFVLDMVGDHQKVGTSIRRHNPEPHPYNNGLYCVGVETVRNLGVQSFDPTAGNAISFEFAEYLCTFAAFLYDVKDDDYVDGSPLLELTRYVERRNKEIGQSIQTTLAAFEFASTTRPAIVTPPSIHVPYREINYVWRYVPGPLTALRNTADSCYGTLNSTQFDGQYPAGTLMYLGMEEEPIPSTPAGNRLYTVTHKFAFFYHGWNYAYRSGTTFNDVNSIAGPWDRVQLRSDHSTPPYASKEFLDLFHL